MAALEVIGLDVVADLRFSDRRHPSRVLLRVARVSARRIAVLRVAGGRILGAALRAALRAAQCHDTLEELLGAQHLPSRTREARAVRQQPTRTRAAYS